MQEMINSDKDPTLQGCKERINLFLVFFPSLNSSINVTKRNFITHSWLFRTDQKQHVFSTVNVLRSFKWWQTWSNLCNLLCQHWYRLGMDRRALSQLCSIKGTFKWPSFKYPVQNTQKVLCWLIDLHLHLWRDLLV